MTARTITAVSIGGIFGLPRRAPTESRSDKKRFDHVHTICSDMCGYVMAPQFLPQCIHRNKNVSAVQKGWMVILTTAHASNGIAVLSLLARK
jgi:hypothetical protein